MTPTTEHGLSITLDDGRTMLALLRPEDQDELSEFIASGKISIEVAASDADLEGHGLSADVAVDVEGHAITLRLPTTADAAALRAALMVAAATATIVAAGAVAGLQGSPAAPGAPSNVNRVQARPPAADLQIRREQRANQLLEAPAPDLPSVDSPASRHGGPSD